MAHCSVVTLNDQDVYGGGEEREREREHDLFFIFTRVMELVIVNAIPFYIQPSGKQSIERTNKTERERGRQTEIDRQTDR